MIKVFYWQEKQILWLPGDAYRSRPIISKKIKIQVTGLKFTRTYKDCRNTHELGEVERRLSHPQKVE